MQLSESSIPGHNLVYQLPSYRRGLLVQDGEALQPFRKVASHHEAILVPCPRDRVGTGNIHRQAFHRNPDDVLVQWLPSSLSSLQHCAVAFIADPAHVSSHPGPVETLLRQRQGACRAQMGSNHPSMELLEKTAASIRHPCPSNSWKRRCSTPPTRYNRSHWRHSTLASRDSGEMSSQRGRSFRARFHLMMGPMSGSASCLGAISSGGQARLAPLTPRHRSYCFNWGLTVPPTLPAWVPGEGIRVPVLPAWSVLERDVVGVNNLNPSCRLPYWVLTPMQPAHGTVVRPDRDLLPV